MTIDEINALQDVQGWERAFQTKKAPKKKKGFWTDQISTGGGIGGALAGAAGGAALGSVVPIAGTAVGGLLGAIIGGAAGSAGGEVAENYVTGEEDKLKNVGNEALWGGVSSVPVLGGLKLARAGVAGATGLGSKSAGQLVKEAGATTIPRRAKNLQFKAAEEIAQYRAPTARGIPGKVAEVGTDLRRGVANTAKVSDSYTQETRILDSLSRNGLTGSASKQYKNIDSTLGNLSKQIDDTLAGITTTAPRKTVISTLQKNATEALPSDPTYAKELTRSLERLSKSGSGDVGGQELFRFKQELGGRLHNAFKKQNMGSPLTAKEEVDMALWKNLNGQISELAPPVKRMTLDQSNLITARPGLQAASQKTAGIPLLGVKSKGVEQVTQAVADKAGRTLSGVQPSVRAGGRVGQSIPGLAVRQSIGGGIAGAINGEGFDQEGLDIQPTGDIDADSQSLLDAPTDGMTDPTQMEGGISREQVMAAMLEDLQTTGGKNIDKIKTIYEFSQPEKADPLSSQASKDLSNATAGTDAIQNLRSLMQRDPSLRTKSLVDGQSLGGLTGAILGTGEYDASRQQAVDVIARLRTGAAITATEEKRFLKMLPQAFDSPEVAEYKLGVLEKAFQTVANRGGGSPQMDALQNY